MAVEQAEGRGAAEVVQLQHTKIARTSSTTSIHHLHMAPKWTEAGFSPASSRSRRRMGAGSPAPPQHTPAEVSSARAAARAAVRAGGGGPNLAERAGAWCGGCAFWCCFGPG